VTRRRWIVIAPNVIVLFKSIIHIITVAQTFRVPCGCVSMPSCPAILLLPTKRVSRRSVGIESKLREAHWKQQLPVKEVANFKLLILMGRCLRLN
jgi:hypothetical protein